MTIIRKNPLFEIAIEDKTLVINNTDFKKDNGRWLLEDILGVELIKHSSILNKIIEVTFGLNYPAKSYELRIRMENGFKDIVLTNCNIENTEQLLYEINQLIVAKENKTN